jgi:choline dehydrogenase
MDTFDYVIIGSGPAGSVLSKRLSADGRTTVCVLEAGISDTHPMIRVPVGFVKTLYDPRFTWPFKSVPTEATLNREINLPQGRLVGGSSSINGLVYSRGQPEDFDDLALTGVKGWSYREILPYFKRSERRIGQADERFRGRTGELPITNPDWKSPLCEAFITGATELGIPKNPDYNGESHDGAGYFQRYIEKGNRISTAEAFLHPAIDRGNVILRIGAEATRILFEGTRAIGVAYDHDGEARQVMARREVIISAGTLNTPKLLQLSGIGDPVLLQNLGIPVHHALQGVGRNLRDHYTVRIAARAKNTVTINERSKGWRLGVEITRWLLGLPSIMALSPSLVHVFWKSNPDLNRGDIQVLFTPASYKPGKTYQLEDVPGMSLGARQQRPESAGTVAITSADPKSLPAIQPNYLKETKDQEVIVAALKIARRLMHTEALKPYLVEETLPGRDVQTDEEWLHYARERGSTAYHMVGTCRMGRPNDPQAVVDETLSVIGLEGLRVVDASVMPQVPSANTLAATLMVAEKAADMILGREAAV